MNLPTPPSMVLTSEWQNVYEHSGITVGTQLIVTTRGKATAYLAESVAEPVGVDGIQCYPMKQAFVDKGSPGLWARADNNSPYTVIVVQQDDNP